MKQYLQELGQYVYQKTIEWLSPLALKLLAQPGAAGIAHKLNLQKQYRIEIGHPDRVAILLVGVGGTGGHVAPILAQLAAWATGQGLDLRLYFIDPDVVEPKNLGRQNFCPAEVGYPKAFTLAWRYQAALGVNIIPVVERFSAAMLERYKPTYSPQGTLMIVIGAVDNVYARRDIAEAISAALARPQRRRDKIWWIDSGNERLHGQVVAGNSLAPEPLLSPLGFCTDVPLPHLQEPGLLQARDRPALDDLSCADLILLEEQSAMINRIMATVVGVYLYGLLQSRDLQLKSTVVNLRSGTVHSTPITGGRLVKPERPQLVPLRPAEPPLEEVDPDFEPCPICGNEVVTGQDEWQGILIAVRFCTACPWREEGCPDCLGELVEEELDRDGVLRPAVVCTDCSWHELIPEPDR
jgi:PRTRC genetic system ThiF family protein